MTRLSPLLVAIALSFAASPPASAHQARRDLGKKTTTLDTIGPADTFERSLISMKHLRGHPRAKDLFDIFVVISVDDLIEHGGLDLEADLDYVFVADGLHVLDHNLGRDAMQAKVDAMATAMEQSITWTDHGKVRTGNPTPDDGSKDPDPRHYIVGPSLVLIAPPTQVAALLKDRSVFTNLGRQAKRFPTAAVQYSVGSLHAKLDPRVGPFELPERLDVIVESRGTAEFEIRNVFKSVHAAQEFVTFWHGPLRRLVDDNFTLKLMFGSFIDEIEVKHTNAEVRIWGTLEPEQLAMLVDIAAKSMRDKRRQLAEARLQRSKARRAPSEAEQVRQ